MYSFANFLVHILTKYWFKNCHFLKKKVFLKEKQLCTMYIYQKERKYLDFRSRIHDKFGSIVQVELGTLLTMPPLTKNLLKKCQISYFILCSFGKHFERNKSDQISQKRLIHTSACTNFGICLIL